MAWELLPVDYTDAVWSGLKRYNTVNNEDGTVSFQDVTVYSGKEKSFFGAKDANRMNEALNTLMSMVENGTDLYTAFQNYFAVQKDLFEEEADSKAEDFDDYTDNLKAEYQASMAQFESNRRSMRGFRLCRTSYLRTLRGTCKISVRNWTKGSVF